MLTKLSYSVTFPTTGRTLAGKFDFKPGFGFNRGQRAGKELHHRGGSLVPVRIRRPARQSRGLQDPESDS